jgi:hypothetical protein
VIIGSCPLKKTVILSSRAVLDCHVFGSQVLCRRYGFLIFAKKLPKRRLLPVSDEAVAILYCQVGVWAKGWRLRWFA